MAYIPWPRTGRSYETALTVGILLATATPAVIGRLYVGLQRRQPKDSTCLVLVAWVSLFALDSHAFESMLT